MKDIVVVLLKLAQALHEISDECEDPKTRESLNKLSKVLLESVSKIL